MGDACGDGGEQRLDARERLPDRHFPLSRCSFLALVGRRPLLPRTVVMPRTCPLGSLVAFGLALCRRGLACIASTTRCRDTDRSLETSDHRGPPGTVASKQPALRHEVKV